MSTRRLALICTLLIAGLTACGDKPRPPDEGAEGLAKTILVHEFWAPDLLRGGILDLFPDGRAGVNVGHLGGGTGWHGTWAAEVWMGRWPEAGIRLTVHLHRMQEPRGEWKAPTELEPPAVLILRGSGTGWWTEEQRTFVPLLDLPLRWKFQGVMRVRKRYVESSFHFVTEDEFRERGGWEPQPLPEEDDK